MKLVLLEFPDIVRLFDFILERNISHVDVKSNPLILSGMLTDDLIVIAEVLYGAVLKSVPHAY